MLLNTLLSRQSTRNVIHIRNQINAIRSSQIRRFSINKEQFEISDEVQDALKNNKPIYILGSPGGSNIIGYVVNAIVSMIDWKNNAQEAASVAHGINKFGTYYLEKNTIMSKLLPSLEAMNYKVKLRSFSSGLNVVHIDDKLYGGSDHRREGIAVGN